MKPIEKPDWKRFFCYGTTKQENIKHLDNWFKNCVEPANELIRNGVEVNVLCLNPHMPTSCFKTVPNDEDATHKALLINIEPIEQDSYEKLVRDIVDMDDVLKHDTFGYALRGDHLKRAKKLLAKGEGE